jgi:hypothetical protein
MCLFDAQTTIFELFLEPKRVPIALAHRFAGGQASNVHMTPRSHTRPARQLLQPSSRDHHPRNIVTMKIVANFAVDVGQLVIYAPKTIF